MFSKSPNYRKLWRDYASPISRASAYAYWLQAARFERQARERGDTRMVNFQERVRVQHQNQLIEWDATEGGNI